ncbi:MAG: NADH:ubiquinone reductase (Na(+)-transporting) subunit E [Woeseia sp.]|nr:NADH:ubiquinone reductase (Na(+)-transporting) subunit E [Woeseia sp.]MBT8098065.1 NADH:ubiquinone reductase (Na(+)-transporting) subunit E [Woeseia sp.]NNE60612.1 NADH:ubiquinone reductase (Na(+)-transporting) subunit E [Woeseia sp.]NNL53637.1 NADH:ubiquinone reductase (Na(+)-transporting) subunit E [Woeseia sp.]
MENFFNIVLRAAFQENLALVFLLGMCTYLAVSRRVGMSVGLGIAVMAVLIITVPINNLLYTALLAPGALTWAGYPALDLSFLRFITFIGVIAALVQILDMFLDRFFPRLHHNMGIYLPLLTVNCAILGASLLMVQRQLPFAESVAYGIGVGIGWAAAVIVFAAIRERLRYSDAPDGLQGLGLSFIVTGLLALGFAGLSGIEI